MSLRAMSLRPITLGLLAFVQFTTPAAADVRLPGIISDHMLLQRDAPVRIFGQATPGEAVSVTFRGESSRATTDPLGRWEAWLVLDLDAQSTHLVQGIFGQAVGNQHAHGGPGSTIVIST